MNVLKLASSVIIKLKMKGGFTCSATMLTATLTAMLTESQGVGAKGGKAEISKSDVMFWYDFGSKHR